MPPKALHESFGLCKIFDISNSGPYRLTRTQEALDGHRPEDCNRELVLAGVGVRSLSAIRPTLEDTFVALTGEGFDVAR